MDAAIRVLTFGAVQGKIAQLFLILQGHQGEKGDAMVTFDKAKAAGTPTWTDLTTPDAEAARKFYHEVFGWDYDIGGPEYGGYTTARLGQQPVAGITSPMEGVPAQPSAWMLYFASDNAVADEAKAK